MRLPLHQHLYLRIWLAVMAVIVVMTLAMGWLWRAQWEHERAQRPGSMVVLRDPSGRELGRAEANRQWVPGQGLEFEVPLADGQSLTILVPRPHRPHPSRGMDVFRWLQSFWGFTMLLAVLALAVAVGAYPIVRRLTQRLEILQQGVERWGNGQLDVRVPVQGHDEIAFLTERFNAAADRVQTLLEAHKAMLAHASHELRSPLARIRMGLELLAQQGSDGGSDPAARRRTSEEIGRNIAELDELVGEILLASRLDLTDPSDAAALGPPEDVDLVGLVAEECARAATRLDVIGPVPDMLLQGHPRLLRRLVRNLLENARRYTPTAEASSIVCELRFLGRQPGEVRWQMVVSDRGPGVPEAYKERIFEPFFRLPGSSEQDGGVGLGLSLVRAIARRHAGSVRCQDRPGGGAQFVVEIGSE